MIWQAVERGTYVQVLFTYYRGGNSHLSFVHSLKDGDFELSALDELCRWFLEFYHTIFPDDYRTM